MNLPSTHHTGPRFKLGRILATPAALKIIADARVSLNDVMVDMQKANIGFQFGLQVRNKLVSAYNEIMQMSV